MYVYQALFNPTVPVLTVIDDSKRLGHECE